MISRVLPLVTILAVLLLSVSIWALHRVSDERDLLSVEIADLENKVEALSNKNQSLQQAFDEYRNGADRLLDEANSALGAKDYDAVKRYADILMQTYTGSAQSIAANRLVEESMKQQDLDRIQEHIDSLSEVGERKKQELLDAFSNTEQLRSIIRIESITTSKPDNNGDIDFSLIWQNTSSKAVKYLHIVASPYNAVGDFVTSSKTNEIINRGSVTGPIASGDWHGEEECWKGFWRNSTIVGARINSIDIEYMDGTFISLNEHDVKQVIY